MAKYCTNCGTENPNGAVRCKKCGAAFPANRTSPPPTKNAPPTFEESRRRTVGGHGDQSAAAASPAYAFGPTGWIGGTFSVLFSQLGKMLGGIFKLFTKLKALLFTAAISALWIWLNHLRLLDGLDGISDVLAKLTYSRGGTGGTVLEIIGGSLGKGIVGAALCSILYGGIGKIARGIKNIFTQPGFHLGAVILGFGIAAFTYQFTAGFAFEDGFMVGIAGAMLSLEALSMREGFLVNLAASFSAKKIKNGRTTGKVLLPGRYKGFLTGSAVGFVVWMILCVTDKMWDIAYVPWVFLYDAFSLDVPDGLTYYLIPAALILVGMILNAVGKGKGKEAGR